MGNELDPISSGLLAVAKAYSEATGQELSTIGRKFHGKARFFGDLQRGACSLTVSNFWAMLQKFSDNWPPGSRWPKLPPIAVKRPRSKHL